MKRRILCSLLLLCAIALTACGHRHQWSDWTTVVAADCEHAGSRERTCSCGVKETEEIAATGHDFDAGQTVAPTAARHGYTLYTCGACNTEKKENVVDPTGSQGLAYEINADGKTCTVTGLGTCKDTELGIPAAIDGYTVTAVANNAFVDQKQIIFLWLAPTVKTIGGMAFANCSGLISASLPAFLDQIGTDAFLNCKKLAEVVNLSSLNIKSGSSAHGRVALNALEVVKESKIVGSGDFFFFDHENANYLVSYIGKSASVVLPKDFKGESYRIHSYAFSDVSDLITSVSFTVPVEIGAYAFGGCERLEKVEINDLQAWCQTNFLVKESNPLYYAKNLYLNGKLLTDAVIPDGTLFVQPNAFINCESLGSIQIPKSVLGIGDDAFAGCTALGSVSYAGSAEDWAKIDLGKGNEALTSHLTH